MNRPFSLMLASSALAVAFMTFPADAALGRAHDAAVSFFATGPGGLKIEGKTSELTVSERDGKIRFVVSLSGVDTGIGLRNKHMREKYLQVAKHPNAELVIDRAALKLAADGAETNGSAAGTMTLHGQTRPVNVTYKTKHSGATHTFEGSVHLNIKEFGIEIPSYMGVTVKPDVDVTVRGKADDV